MGKKFERHFGLTSPFGLFWFYTMPLVEEMEILVLGSGIFNSHLKVSVSYVYSEGMSDTSTSWSELGLGSNIPFEVTEPFHILYLIL